MMGENHKSYLRGLYFAYRHLKKLPYIKAWKNTMHMVECDMCIPLRIPAPRVEGCREAHCINLLINVEILVGIHLLDVSCIIVSCMKNNLFIHTGTEVHAA